MNYTYFDIDYSGKRVKFSFVNDPQTFTGYCLATYLWGERVMLTAHITFCFTLSDEHNGFFVL